MRDLLQAWPRPTRPLPMVVIGAGAIVRTAHLPAYTRLGPLVDDASRTMAIVEACYQSSARGGTPIP